MSAELSEMEKRNVLRLSNAESNRLTRECMETAMLRLLSEKTIEDVSVTELVHVAGVSRNAFYCNYSSKEEVLSSWVTRFVDEMVNSVWPYARSGELSEMYRRLFCSVRADADRAAVLVKAGLQQLLTETIEKNILEQLPALSADARYILTGWSGLFSGIMLRWYQNGMRESDEHMAELCGALTAVFSDALRTDKDGHEG